MVEDMDFSGSNKVPTLKVYKIPLQLIFFYYSLLVLIVQIDIKKRTVSCEYLAGMVFFLINKNQKPVSLPPHGA